MTSTPSNKVQGDTKASKWFSKVIVPNSPASASTHKNITGLPRVARDIAADVYNNIQKWNEYHIKGASLTKSIVQLKSNNPKEFSEGLEHFTNDLDDVILRLCEISGALEFLVTQMQSLVKLHKKCTPLFFSLNNEQLVEIIQIIGDAYKAEFKVKEFVSQNIAHSKNKTEVMFYGACWAHQQNITNEINMKLEILLTETGHRKYNLHEKSN